MRSQNFYTTGKQFPQTKVPTAGFQESVDVQLCTLGNEITHVKLGVGSHATHVHADQAAMAMVAKRAGESCAMVSSLNEEQQREESRQLCRMWP